MENGDRNRKEEGEKRIIRMDGERRRRVYLQKFGEGEEEGGIKPE